MNQNTVKERIVLVLTIMSFISITIQAISTYNHNISSIDFCQHVKTRFMGMLLTEMFIIYFSWQVVLTSNSIYSVKLTFCYLYLLVSIMTKYICSRMLVKADIILFIVRAVYIKSNYPPLRSTNVCYRCTHYAVEENMYNILRIRVYICNINSLYVLFSVITAIYSFIRELYSFLFIFLLLLLLNNGLSRFDKDESIVIRTFFLLFYLFNVFYNVFLLKYLFKFKE